MPKTEIDYSNTIIYKITCKDSLVTDLYVGHTTNFVQRKHGHKQGCKNEKSSNYNCKLYKAIRANGGWDNWVMEIVAFFKCNDHYEARIKEQEYFTSLNATLNSLEPLPKPKPKPIDTPEPVKTTYFCETCNATLQNQRLLEVHNQTKKHCKKVMGVDTIDNAKFYCKCCDFKCSKLCDWERHITRPKHLNNVNMIQNDTSKTPKNAENMNEYICECGNIYKHHSGLWRHKSKGTCLHKKCDVVEKETKHHEPTDKELIMMLIKENSDFKSMMIKMLENGTHSTSNTINTVINSS